MLKSVNPHLIKKLGNRDENNIHSIIPENNTRNTFKISTYKYEITIKKFRS